MALTDRIKDLAIRIGQEIKSLRLQLNGKVDSSGNAPSGVLKTNSTGDVVVDTNPQLSFPPVDGDEYLTKDGVWVKYNPVTSLDWDTQIDNKPTDFPPSSHIHDDRYYTEAEIDAVLAGKSDTTHTHDDRYYTEAEVDTFLLGKEDAFSKSTAFNKNFGILVGTVSEGNHNHNNIYFTKAEVNSLIDSVGNSNHDHNDIYYTKVQIDLLLQDDLGDTHDHDDRYYTEAEIDSFLLDKASIIHTHDDLYYPKSVIDNLIGGLSTDGHIHDDRYYTEAEVDAALDTKADLIHEHDDRYYTEAEVTTLLDELEIRLTNQLVAASNYSPPEGIPVSLTEGKTFGKYINGDILPGNTSLLQLVTQAVTEIVAAVFKEPSAELVGNPDPTIPREVGDLLSFTVDSNFVQEDAGLATRYVITKDGTTVVDSASASSYSEVDLILTLSGVEYSSTIEYSEGTGTKPNSIGTQEANFIAAGVLNTNKIIYKGYMPIFYGNTPTVYTTGAQVRDNLAMILNTDLESFILNTGSTNLNYQFWLPSNISLVSVIDLDALNADISISYTSTSVDVTDGGGSYRAGKLYTLTADVPYFRDHRHQVNIQEYSGPSLPDNGNGNGGGGTGNGPIPEFTSPESTTIIENVDSEEIILNVNANDGDGGSSDADIVYSLSGDTTGFFSIDNSTGDLRRSDGLGKNDPQNPAGNNVYEFKVTATNTSSLTTAEQDIKIFVYPENVLDAHDSASWYRFFPELPSVRPSAMDMSYDGQYLAVYDDEFNGGGSKVVIYRFPEGYSGTRIVAGTITANEVTDLSMSSDGKILAVGYSLNKVAIYGLDETESWSQIGSDIDGEAAGDSSGWSVSLSADGNIVAIGAYRNDESGFESGHVRVYENNNGTWTQIGDDIDGEAVGDNSGRSVSLSADGRIVAIGASLNDGVNGNYSGHVRIYENNNGTWTQLGGDIDGEAANDQSGFSVSLSADGSVVAIGPYTNDSGHVRVYQYSNNTWNQLGNDIDGKVAGDFFGRSLSLSADGKLLVVGAQSHNSGSVNSGSAWIYRLNPTENPSIFTWYELNVQLKPQSSANNIYYGSKVKFSLDGGRLAIAAPGLNQVYVYTNPEEVEVP